MPRLEDDLRGRLIRFAKALSGQRQARVAAPAQQPEAGYSLRPQQARIGK